MEIWATKKTELSFQTEILMPESGQIDDNCFISTLHNVKDSTVFHMGVWADIQQA